MKIEDLKPIIYIISFGILVFIIVFIIVFVPTKLKKNANDNIFKNRIQKCLAVYENYPQINQQNIPNNGKYFNKYYNTQKYYGLRDFFYSASYKSYLPCGFTNDVVSYNAIKNVLLAGARVINLDIFFKGPYPFADESEIIVGNVIDGKLSFLQGSPENQHYLNFSNCLDIINDLAWKKTDAPLFLYLKLEFSENKKLEYQVYSQLLSKLSSRFLDKYYSFQRVNIGDIPFNMAQNKLIILTDRKPVCGQLNEITNGLMSPMSTNLILYSITDTDVAYGGIKTHFPKKENAQETTQFNLVAVIKEIKPNKNNRYNPKIDTINYDTSENFDIGISITFMNWQNYPGNDKHMENYLERFKEGGMILKPQNLIYQTRPKPTVYKRDNTFDYNNNNVSGLNGFYNFNT